MTTQKQLEFSHSSVADIAAIKRYLASDNPIAANQVVKRIIATADSLSVFPLLGRTGRKAGTRELVVPKYP